MQSSKVKVHIITERKALEVTPGYLKGSPSLVLVNVCVTCGAVVFDVIQHDMFHRIGGHA